MFSYLAKGSIIAIFTLSILGMTVVLAQDEPVVVPLEVHLIAEQTSLDLGESSQTTLTLNNTSPYTITDINVQLQGRAFSIVDAPSLTHTLASYDSTQAKYILKSQIAGSSTIVFTIEYIWNDSSTGLPHRRVETVYSENINVKDSLEFDWPNYLIPLLLGFIMGQLGAWFIDWRKRLTENEDRKEQAKGIMLAILQAARKGVDKKERISFDLWENAIVKGNLYPAIHQFGRSIDKPELSKRLAELSILMSDYNNRRDNSTLTEDFSLDLIDELNDLINMVRGK